jgi:hypothetical protein
MGAGPTGDAASSGSGAMSLRRERRPGQAAASTLEIGHLRHGAARARAPQEAGRRRRSDSPHPNSIAISAASLARTCRCGFRGDRGPHGMNWAGLSVDAARLSRISPAIGIGRDDAGAEGADPRPNHRRRGRARASFWETGRKTSIRPPRRPSLCRHGRAFCPGHPRGAVPKASPTSPLPALKPCNNKALRARRGFWGFALPLTDPNTWMAGTGLP